MSEEQTPEPERDPGSPEEEDVTETKPEPRPVIQGPPVPPLARALQEMARRLGGGAIPDPKRFAEEFRRGREERSQRPKPAFGASLRPETEEEVAARRGTSAAMRRLRRERQCRTLHERVPRRFRERPYDWSGNRAWGDVQEWMEAVKRHAAGNLYLFGADVGTGKSHALWDIGQRLSDAGPWVVGWSMPALNAAMRPDGDPEALDDAKSCDLLLIDELGAEKRSPWTQERLYEITDHRWGNRLPTAFTGNLDPDALEDCYGAPIRDRLFDDALLVEMKGSSRRNATA